VNLPNGALSARGDSTSSPKTFVGGRSGPYSQDGAVLLEPVVNGAVECVHGAGEADVGRFRMMEKSADAGM